jgi:hypothetical protein
VQDAVKTVAGVVLESGISFSSIIGEGNRLCIVLAYPACCMPHAEVDLQTFRTMLLQRGTTDPATAPGLVKELTHGFPTAKPTDMPN